MDDLLMGVEAAAYVGVSYKRLHQLTKEGYGRKVSGHWMFTKAELDAYRTSEKDKGGRPAGSPNKPKETHMTGLAVA
jgi:hypothetical protein